VGNDVTSYSEESIGKEKVRGGGKRGGMRGQHHTSVVGVSDKGVEQRSSPKQGKNHVAETLFQRRKSFKTKKIKSARGGQFGWCT